MWKTIDLSPEQLRQCVADCECAGVTYGLGGKAPTLSAEPGEDFKRIDCSGFVRWAIYRASAGAVTFPDGSVVQHDFVTAEGFKHSDVSAGSLIDGRVRIAFLSPHDGGGVGHVVLIHNGKTLESCSGHGPCRRPWTKTGWQSRAAVYVLDMETAS